jgi:hypothetical protein
MIDRKISSTHHEINRAIHDRCCLMDASVRLALILIASFLAQSINQSFIHSKSIHLRRCSSDLLDQSIKSLFWLLILVEAAALPTLGRSEVLQEQCQH